MTGPGPATAPAARVHPSTMAHQTLDHLYCILGFVLWGDLGPTTIYRNKKGRVVFFEKTWPHKPPSDAQTTQRQKFTDAAAAWKNLPTPWRARWDLATRRASLCMHGYDLFVHYHTTNDTAAIQTLERQTSLQLLPP